MGDLIQLLVSGTATGAIYALAALGFTLLWQASGVDQLRAGRVRDAAGVRDAVRHRVRRCRCGSRSSSPASLAMLVLGSGFKRGIVDPLIRHGVIPLVIATLGLAIAAQDDRARRLQRRSASVPEPVPGRAVRRRRHQRLVRGHRHAGPRRRDRHRAADVPQPDGDRPRDAGGRAEHRSRRACSASTSGGWCSTCS